MKWQTIDELIERVCKSAGASGANSESDAINAIKATEAAVDTMYIRADEGKAYWVKGTENGAIELW